MNNDLSDDEYSFSSESAGSSDIYEPSASESESEICSDTSDDNSDESSSSSSHAVNNLPGPSNITPVTNKCWYFVQGRKTRFIENRPGPDWMNLFLKRQPKLSERMAECIKRARAGVTVETIQAYFDKLKVSLQGIPPCNIVNYDETAFIDDVGTKKVWVQWFFSSFYDSLGAKVIFFPST